MYANDCYTAFMGYQYLGTLLCIFTMNTVVDAHPLKEHLSKNVSEPVQATSSIQMVPLPWPNSALVEALTAPLYPSCRHTTWVHAQKSMLMCCNVPPICYTLFCTCASILVIYSAAPFPPHLSCHSCLAITFTFLPSHFFLQPTLPLLQSIYPHFPTLPYGGIIDVPGVIAHCTPHSIVLHFHTTTVRGGASHQT